MIFKKGDFINDCEILEIHNNPNKNKITLDVRCLKCGRTRNVCYKNIFKDLNYTFVNTKIYGIYASSFFKTDL